MNRLEQIISKCESPIEVAFIEAIEPQLGDWVKIVPQVAVKLSAARYRFDFCFEHGGRQVVVECDGRDFHDFWEDWRRDMHTLNETNVTEIFRFRGCDIVHHIESCVSTMRLMVPDLFDAVEQTTLEQKRMAGWMLHRGQCKPIVRCKGWCGQIPARDLEDDQTTTLLGRASDGRIAIQMKSPYWHPGNPSTVRQVGA